MSLRSNEPAVRKLNDLLRQELGERPLYGWQWSEDLLHVSEVYNEDGIPVLEERKVGFLVLMERKKTVVKMFPQLGLNEQWVVCSLIELDNPDGLIHATGSAAWIPVTDRYSRPVCLPVGERPDLAATWEFIRWRRDYLSTELTRQQDWDYHNVDLVPLDETMDWPDMVSRKERAGYENIRTRVKDLAPAFNTVPGEKLNTSFPSQGKGENSCQQ